MSSRAELNAAAEFLTPELALEVYRLQQVEDEHQALLVGVAELRRQLHAATVMAGELRHRATRAERRLEDLGAEEISKARLAAHMLGDGYVRVTCLGRGRFTTQHVPTERVTLRA